MYLEVTGDFINLNKLNYANLSPVMRAFHAYMVRQTDRMFEEGAGPGSAQSGGSMVRGVQWQPLKSVSGKRPSGQKITPLSALLQDTGRLRQLAATEVYQSSPTSMVMGTRLPYAIFQDQMRPILFMTDEDANYAQKLIDKQYAEMERNPGRNLLDMLRGQL